MKVSHVEVDSTLLLDDLDEQHHHKTFFVGEILEEFVCQETEWNQILYLNDLPVNFKIDTGSPVNILPVHIFDSLGSNARIKQVNLHLRNVNSGKIPVLGSVFLWCSLPNQKVVRKEFIIVDLKCNALLGLKTCLELNLVQRVESISNDNYSCVFKKYSEVFSNKVGRYVKS